MTRSALIIVLALGLTASACASSPALEPNWTIVPERYDQARTIDRANGADLAWKTVLRDPRLQALVEQALVQSRDLRSALLDVQAARAQLGVQNAERFPQVQAGIENPRTRTAPTGTVDQAAASLSLTAFEVDLFGRLRAQSASAMNSYLAAEEGSRAARIILITTVAEAYLAERASAERLALVKTTLADWNAQLDLTRRLKFAGQASALDLVQAEGQAEGAQADLASAERAHAVANNALTLAVGGSAPPELPAPMVLADGPIVTELPAGLPSDLLRRRPDLLQAEKRLMAARADIQAARAAFFPRLGLTAALGLASTDLGKLFSGGTKTWSFTPQITQPIFQGGRLRGQYDLAKVRGESAVAAYEKAVQVAFREVGDGLAGRETFGRQVQAQEAAVATARTRASLSSLRFRNGLDSRLELLDAQRSLYVADLALLQLRQEQAAEAVKLYRALGGGHDVPSAVSSR